MRLCAFSSNVSSQLLSISMLFDFSALIFMQLLVAHYSVISIVFSSYIVYLGSSVPIIVVSSAYIYGKTLPFNRFVVRSLVNILNSRQDILHPCPNPLPICQVLECVCITRLLNIIFIPWMTIGSIFISYIFLNRISWFTISQAFAKSMNSIHIFFPSYLSLSSVVFYKTL